MHKMCKLMGIGCDELDIEEKIKQKVSNGKSLDYDEQKIYIKLLENELRKCQARLGEIM